MSRTPGRQVTSQSWANLSISSRAPERRQRQKSPVGDYPRRVKTKAKQRLGFRRESRRRGSVERDTGLENKAEGQLLYVVSKVSSKPGADVI